VSTDFFETLGIPVVQGRPIGAGDDEHAVPVAVVNRAFAQQTFGGRPAIGKAVMITPPGADAAQTFQIVGVVGDAKEKDLLGPSSPIVYFSDRQASFPHTVLAVRAAERPPLREVRAALRELDPSLALDDVTLLAARVKATYALQLFLLNILTAFALSAAVLIGVGIYGSVSCAVNAAVKGIGVRMALGATRTRILRSVLARVCGWSTLGAALGLGVFAGVGRLASALGVSAEPRVAVTGALCAIALAAVATWLPAWRAAATDPIVVLKA
jgi:ABC-type antimicrobial peptide transport system permease subunit